MHPLPHDGLALASLDEQLLIPGVKGLPITEPLHQGAIGVQGWKVLHADTSFPVAVLKTSALKHNLDWMRRFCERHKVSLAPHGKTTMSPQLFGAQLANGAWGITLASATQIQVAHRFGVRRVLLANQLVAPADIKAILALLHDDPDFECIVLADSLAGVARLAEAVAAHPLPRPLPVLVELGLAGKRAGCRTPEEALTVARAVEGAPGLLLAGFAAWRARRLARSFPLDLDQPYYRKLADSIGAGTPAVLRVLPYSFTLDEARDRGLWTVAAMALGAQARVLLRPTVPYGEEPKEALREVASEEAGVTVTAARRTCSR